MRAAGFIFILLVFLAGCSLFPALEDGRGRRYALVYGVSNYSYVSGLSFPSADAMAVATLFSNAGYITTLRLDDVVTKTGISNDIAAFATNLTQADSFLFYFAGHGLQISNTNYLVPFDAVLSYPGTMVTGAELSLWLSALPTSKNALIIDHCYSGGYALEYKSGFVITGGGTSELTWEYKELGHGVFTYFFLKGVTNHRADLNGDHRIMLSEAYYYLSPLVKGFTSNFNVSNEMQRPQYYGGPAVEMSLLEY